MNCIFRPVAKKAPPRPRRLAAFSSPITSAGAIPRARYSPSCVRSRSSAPARTITSLMAQLLDDLRHVPGRDVQPVAIVDRDDGRPPTAADALDRPQRKLAVRRRLAGLHAERSLERRQDLLRAAQSAADVRADLDQTPPDGREMEHVVEGRDPLAVGGGELQ